MDSLLTVDGPLWVRQVAQPPRAPPMNKGPHDPLASTVLSPLVFLRQGWLMWTGQKPSFGMH